MALIRTNETATAQELRELFDMEPDEQLQEIIPVCDGEWRCERQLADLPIWRVWSNGE